MLNPKGGSENHTSGPQPYSPIEAETAIPRPASNHELRSYIIEPKVELPHLAFLTFIDEGGFMFALRRVLACLSESFGKCFGHFRGGGGGIRITWGRQQYGEVSLRIFMASIYKTEGIFGDLG